MLRLLLLRHAKSDWPGGLGDLERPLARRGLEAAPRMGHYLVAEHLLPDLALVSPSRRTRDTWDLVAATLPGPPPHRIEDTIYEAPMEHLLEAVRATPAGVRTLILVGHNPGSQELAQDLVGYGDRYAAQRLAAKFPTCGLAVIDFDLADWSAVALRAGRLDRFVTPATLGHGPDE
jgi:phosphohistidine phosphatase